MIPYNEIRLRLGDLLNDMEAGVAPMFKGPVSSKPEPSQYDKTMFRADSGIVNNSPIKPELVLAKTQIADAAPPKFKFGASSEKELIGVKPELVRLARLSLTYTTQDFMVFDGLRTEAEQRALVNRGASKTMLSKHRVQPDGFGHALDFVPYVDSKPSWTWPHIYAICVAVDRAATDLGIADNIVWGGAWDRRLSDFGGNADAYEKEVRDYATRHPGKDFLDGPHYQWAD